MAGEAFGLDRGDGGRDVEHLRGLGQRDHVVLQRLPVDRLHPERHLRLLVDEQDLAVVRGEEVEEVGRRFGHGVSPLRLRSRAVDWLSRSDGAKPILMHFNRNNLLIITTYWFQIGCNMDRLDAMRALHARGDQRQLRGSGAPARADALGGLQGRDRTGASSRRAAARSHHAARDADRSRARLSRADRRHPCRCRGNRSRGLASARRAEGTAEGQRADVVRYAVSVVGDRRFHGGLSRAADRGDHERSLHRSARGRRRCHGADRRAAGFQPDRAQARAGAARAGRVTRLI